MGLGTPGTNRFSMFNIVSVPSALEIKFELASLMREKVNKRGGLKHSQSGQSSNSNATIPLKMRFMQQRRVSTVPAFTIKRMATVGRDLARECWLGDANCYKKRNDSMPLLTILWEKMRQRNIGKEDTSQLLGQALTKMKGKIHEIVGSHVSCCVLQTQIMKEYPAELTVVFFYNLIVSILAAIAGSFTVPNPNAWKLKPDIALASILCSCMLGSCLNNSVHTWALRLKGPLFVSMFKPLSIVIVVVMGVMFLGDDRYLGSVIGAAIISIGFYTVMWGKAKEDTTKDEVINSESSQHKDRHCYSTRMRTWRADRLKLLMDNALIDDRRIHVDFSQSVSKEQLEKGCFKCGSVDHIARDCTGSTDTKQAPKYTLKDDGFTRKGGNDSSRYDMVFDEETGANSPR
ncbi:WAT1-related protein [Tanacetum coccineum]